MVASLPMRCLVAALPMRRLVAVLLMRCGLDHARLLVTGASHHFSCDQPSLSYSTSTLDFRLVDPRLQLFLYSLRNSVGSYLTFIGMK